MCLLRGKGGECGGAASHVEGALAGGGERGAGDDGLQLRLPGPLSGDDLAGVFNLGSFNLQELEARAIRFEDLHGLGITPLEEISHALHGTDVGRDVAQVLGVTQGKVGHHGAKGLMVEFAGTVIAAFHSVKFLADVQEGDQSARIASGSEGDEVRPVAVPGPVHSVAPGPADDVATRPDIRVAGDDLGAIGLFVGVNLHAALVSDLGCAVKGSMCRLVGSRHHLRVST